MIERRALIDGVWDAVAATICLVAAASASPAAPRHVEFAQLGDPGPGGPSYSYQPYNDRNPTGFYHPGGMGFGHYYLTQKYHTPRFRAFHYRRFRGT